jgi:uncharacterized OsmC-like protein
MDNDKPHKPFVAPKAGYAHWGATLGIATLWVLYLFNAMFHIDLIAFMHPSQPGDVKVDMTPVSLVLAIVATVVGVPWSIARAKKRRRLESTGVRIDGKVVAKSPLRKYGMAPCTIAYTVDGKEYRIKKDLLSKSHDVGDTVQILSDPANPNTSRVL